MAGDTRKVTLVLTAQNRALLSALQESGLVAEETAKTMGDRMDTASTKVGGAFSKIGQSIESFTGIPVAGPMEKMGKSFEDASTKGQKFSQIMRTIGGAALVGTAAAVAAIGYESIKAADEFDVAQAQLQVAIKNTGNSFEKVKPQLDATYASMANVGYNSTETASALATLTLATKNPAVAMKDLSVAADLARFKHEDLATASGALAKIMAGSTRVLTQLGINIDVGNGKMKAIDAATQALTKSQQKLNTVQTQIADGALTGAKAQAALQAAQDGVSSASQKLHKDQSAIANIMDAIKSRTEGAARAYGNTLAGQMSIARAQIHNVQTVIGEKLIPVLAKAATAVADIIKWFEKHKAVAEALAIALGVVLVAAMADFAIGVVATAITTIAAMSAVDIALAGIPILIGLLVAAGVWLVANWSRVWTDVKNWVSDAVNWIRDHLLLVAAVGGPIGMLVAAVVWLGSNWSSIWGGIQTAVSYTWAVIKPIFDAISGGVKTVAGDIGTIVHLGSTVGGAIGKAASFLGFADGGQVPGANGTAVPAIVHGGEFVLSRAMLEGRDNSWTQAFKKGGAQAVSSTTTNNSPQIVVNANTNANPAQIANAIGWALRKKVAA